MSSVIWSTLVRNYYYVISSGGSSFEFGIKFLKNYLVAWPIPDFMVDDVLSLAKMPWEIYREFYQGTSPTRVYQIENNLSLSEIDDSVIPCWMIIDAPEIPLTTVYTVLARRWGSSQGHTYLVGTSATYEGALELGKIEENLRGGKYKSEIRKGYLESGGGGATEILKNSNDN